MREREEKNPKYFAPKFSPGWLEGFKKRYGIRIGNKATTKDHRYANNELMERILNDWLVHQQANNTNVTGPMIMAKVINLKGYCHLVGCNSIYSIKDLRVLYTTNLVTIFLYFNLKQKPIFTNNVSF